MKEKFENLNYEQLQQVIRSVCQNGQLQSGENFYTFLSAMEGVSEGICNLPDNLSLHFAAFKTADRGVVLVLFKITFVQHNDVEQVKICPLFIEDKEMMDYYRCPYVILNKITDEKAAAFKQQVQERFSIQEECNLLKKIGEIR